MSKMHRKTVIYNIYTGQEVATYPTERGAKIALTRKYKKHEELSWMDWEIWKFTFPSVDVIGSKGIKVKSDTPLSCDPNNETYWSM